MKNSTILHELTPDDISNIVKEAIQKQLAEFKKSFEPKQAEEFLTRTELSEMLKCDESTISNWVKKGKFNKHCIGGRTYYLHSEVLSAIKPI